MTPAAGRSAPVLDPKPNMEHDIELRDIGWKALQQRLVHLDKLLRQAIRGAQDRDDTIRMLDLALGSGRQVFEVLRSLPAARLQAEFRDIDTANLDKGRQLANQLGLTGLRFTNQDAFDPEALRSIDPETNVALATGIFELTPDNQKVRGTLEGLAAAIKAGSFLVYTDQPHHPELEMIGRIAVHRDESPWAMRRRPDEEMDQLLREAGFQEIERLSDDYGLFRVGLARKA